MTDKEMAEKTVMSHAEKAIQEQIPYFEFAEQMFLAGLKAGKPKWHKVADGDLPEDGKLVISNEGSFVFYKFIKNDYSYWFEFRLNYDIKLSKWEEPTAWCEIPKYMEED